MSFKRNVSVVLVFLFGFLVAGCATTTATPTPSPTPTQPAIEPIEPTPMRMATPTPEATPEIETWTSTSPDGRWIITGGMSDPFVEGDFEKYRTQLIVASADGAIKWMAVDEVRNWGLGYTFPQVFHWSRDGRYLYFTNVAVPDGCALFTGGSDLHRLDLSDGSITPLLAEIGGPLSLSSDEKTLAQIYWNGDALEMVLHDLASGDERRIELDSHYEQAGNMIWSPDGQSLMLIAVSKPCLPPDWTQSVIRIDVAQLTLTTLVRDDDRLFSIQAWTEAERVTLIDKDGHEWWMDASTGQLTPIAAPFAAMQIGEPCS